MSEEAVMRPQLLRYRSNGLQVGDRVTFHYVTTEVAATVIEDRGPLGGGGRRLLRLRLDPEYESFGNEIELPAEELHTT